MRKQTEYKLDNNDRNDIAELIILMLENLEYDRERIVHYSLLLEEATILWQSELSPDTVFSLRRTDTKRSAVVELIAPGEKINPFEIGPHVDEERELLTMRDRLLAGIGTELRYRYRHNRNIIRMVFPKKNYEERLFTRNLLLLIIPVMLSMITTSIASNVDAVMLSFLNASSMSAVSLLASFISFSQLMSCALSSHMLSVMAQFWGKRERKTLSMASGFTLDGALLASMFPFAVSVFFPGWFMHLFTDDPLIWSAGVDYLRILGFAFPVFALINVINNLLNVTGEINKVLRNSFISNSLNIVLNMVFIFGAFGLPQMGVKGAALATLISYAVHLFLAYVTYRKNCTVRFDILFFREKLGAPMKKFIRMSAAKLAQCMSYAVAMMIISAAWGHLDPAVIASVTLANSIFICLGGAFGSVGQAAGILIGGYLGRNKFDTAWKKSKQAIRICIKIELAFLALCVLICLSYYVIPTDISPEAMNVFPAFIIAFTVTYFFHGMNELFISGFLMTGGEIKPIIITDVIVDWGILVPIALLGTNVLGMSSVIVAILLNTHEVLTYPFRFISYRKKKWLKNLNTADRTETR